MKEPCAENFPFDLTQKNFTTTVYRREYQKKGGTYTEFKFAFYDVGGKRQFRTASSWAGIEKAATDVADTQRAGNASTLTLTAEDKTIYTRAVDAVKPFGVSLDVAALEYADVRRLLGGASLAEAVKYYRDRHAVTCELTVQQVVDEFIASLEQRKVKRPGERHLADLRSRLDRFAETFPNNRLDDITAANVGAFLDQYDGRTRFNYQRIVKSLFNYARARKFVAKDFDEFENVATGFDDDGEISVFTPAELSKILSAARPEMIPFITIGAFAGLRSAEIARLDWSEISETHIVLKKGKTKTRSRRIVPLQPNLSQWIATHRKESGPVVPFASMGKQIAWLADDAKVTWKRNALRHSYVSYRLAAIQDENRVAAEAGHSPQMLHKNYREVVTEDAAKAWFAIVPEMPANGIPADSVAVNSR